MYRMNLFPNDRVSSVRSITIFIMDPSFQEMQRLGIFPLHLLFEYKIIFILILHYIVVGMSVMQRVLKTLIDSRKIK